MKQIPLTQGKYAIVDDEDYDRLMAMGSWCLGNGYPQRRKPGSRKSGMFKMHRVVMNISDPNVIVDHKNQDTLDNRKCNLRICTIGQNNMNSKKRKSNTFDFKGVRQRCGKWSARIRFERREIHLGTFNTQEEAVVAYNKGAKEYFGEFANLNEI